LDERIAGQYTVWTGCRRGAHNLQVQVGEPIRFERIVEYADGDLAYILEFERWRGKAGSSDEIVPMALRVTTIFRREDGVWKIALRQADPITTPRAIESVRDQEG
jgi:ketosteroid isomerase-like protein